MRRVAGAIAFLSLFLWAGAVDAGKGGKLSFSHDVEKALADARMTGKAAVLYFTTDG